MVGPEPPQKRSDDPWKHLNGLSAEERIASLKSSVTAGEAREKLAASSLNTANQNVTQANAETKQVREAHAEQIKGIGEGQSQAIDKLVKEHRQANDATRTKQWGKEDALREEHRTREAELQKKAGEETEAKRKLEDELRPVCQELIRAKEDLKNEQATQNESSQKIADQGASLRQKSDRITLLESELEELGETLWEGEEVVQSATENEELLASTQADNEALKKEAGELNSKLKEFEEGEQNKDVEIENLNEELQESRIAEQAADEARERAVEEADAWRLPYLELKICLSKSKTELADALLIVNATKEEIRAEVIRLANEEMKRGSKHLRGLVDAIPKNLDRGEVVPLTHWCRMKSNEWGLTSIHPRDEPAPLQRVDETYGLVDTAYKLKISVAKLKEIPDSELPFGYAGVRGKHRRYLYSDIVRYAKVNEITLREGTAKRKSRSD